MGGESSYTICLEMALAVRSERTKKVKMTQQSRHITYLFERTRSRSLCCKTGSIAITASAAARTEYLLHRIRNPAGRAVSTPNHSSPARGIEKMHLP